MNKRLYKIYKINNPAEGEETVVILGNPARKDGMPSKILKSRLDTALHYVRDHKVKNIIVTGKATYNEFEEAEAQRKYLIAHHIPDTMIIKENQSTSTPDNALYVYRIANTLNLQHLVIITSHYHKKRSEYIFNHYFERYKMVTPFPAILHQIKNFPYYLWESYCLYRTKKGDDRLNRR